MPLGISPDGKICGVTSRTIPARTDVWGFRTEAAELNWLAPQVRQPDGVVTAGRFAQISTHY